MARIRTIKPSAFVSETLTQLPRDARWTFVGLLTYVDDEGRGRDNPRIIKGALYPLDDDVTAAVIEAEMGLMYGVGVICRYNAEGSWFHFPNWGEHQRVNRPTASAIPACEKHNSNTYSDSGAPLNESSTVTHGTLSESSVSPHGGNKEGNKEGTQRVRAGKLPKTWSPNAGHVAAATTHHLDLTQEADKFRDYHAAKGSTFKDWDAAFRNWLRKAAEFRGPIQQPRRLPTATELLSPPDGLSPTQLQEWFAAHRTSA